MSKFCPIGSHWQWIGSKTPESRTKFHLTLFILGKNAIVLFASSSFHFHLDTRTNSLVSFICFKLSAFRCIFAFEDLSRLNGARYLSPHRHKSPKPNKRKVVFIAIFFNFILRNNPAYLVECKQVKHEVSCTVIFSIKKKSYLIKWTTVWTNVRNVCFEIGRYQCDQIGRFIGLWATF